MRSVLTAGETLPAATWRKALACGDMLDRLPCALCGAERLSQCSRPLNKDEIAAARDYINGHGWTAAKILAQGDA